MDDEKAKLDQAKAANKSADDKLQQPKEPTSEASTDKLKGGKEAADKFVDQAKKQ